MRAAGHVAHARERDLAHPCSYTRTRDTLTSGLSRRILTLKRRMERASWARVRADACPFRVRCGGWLGRHSADGTVPERSRIQGERLRDENERLARRVLADVRDGRC
jgi:hypothetical protein